MSKYEVNDYGKIYSDFAYRLGIIARQYDELQIEDEYKYESTLYICILQNLLTQFWQVKDWAKHSRRKTPFDVEVVWDRELPFWGIYLSDVKVPKEENLNIGDILEEIRHILSHPLPVSSGLEYTSDSDLGKILLYNFIRKNQQQDIEFQVDLKSQQVKDLVAHLSDYLSNIAKEITERTEDHKDFVLS